MFKFNTVDEALEDLRQGALILRQASRLDAFSGYLFRT